MRSKVILALLLLLGVGARCQNLASPYSNSVFPAQIFSTTKTGTPIQLNGLVVPSTIGSSFASGSITLTGTSLTTVTFSVLASTDNGVTYNPWLIWSVLTPSAQGTTQTATGNGIYQLSLAGVTHIKFVTSGTFTASSISLVLTASPNAMVSRGGSSTGGAVNSVNGHTGTVVLAATDVGADAAGAASSAQTAAIASAASTALQKSGGTMTGAIVLPGDPTTALQASTKQYVDAHAGGGGTCPLKNAKNICITDSPYNAVADGTTNNYAAFNAAIAAAGAAGGATIWVPTSGTYLVNGALQDTGCANAILPMPKLPNYVGNPIVITIKGLDAPGGTSGQTGEVIQTSTASGNFFGGCDSAAGGGFPPFTNVKLKLENLTLSSYTNPGVVMVNATSLMGFVGKSLYCNMPSVSLPTNTAGGCFFLPAVGNNLEISLDDVQSAGYYTLYKIGEHAHLGQVNGSFGVNCFQFDNGTTPAGTFVGNSASVENLWTGHCTNSIAGPSVNPMTVNILVADLETSTAEEVSDASNLLHGIINFTIPQDNGVPINCTPRVVGGANLKLNPLQCQAAGGGPPSGMIENWKSQDGSGTTLANTGSDSTNSMTTTNVTWTTVSGFTLPVATYNGSTSTATAASFTNTNFTGATPFSICQWVNPSSLPSSSNILLANTSSTTGIAVEMLNTGAYQVFLLNTAGFIEVSTTSAMIPVGANTLACFTYAATGAASGVTSYLNGTAVANTVISDTLSGSIASGFPMRIGSGGGPSFTGPIGGNRIFNRLLSAAEIAAMFTAGPNAY